MQKIEIKHWNPDPAHPVDLQAQLNKYSEASCNVVYHTGSFVPNDEQFSSADFKLDTTDRIASTSTYNHNGINNDRVSINTFATETELSVDAVATAMQDTIAGLAKNSKNMAHRSTLNWCAQVGCTVITANVGDTRAYLMVKDGDKFVATPLNWPQRSDDEYETERFRVNPRIYTSSRALGFGFHAADPEITTVEVPEGVEAYVIQLSQVHSDQNRIELSDAYIANFFNEHGIEQNAARQLVTDAVQCGANKEVSAIVMPVVAGGNQVTVASMAEGSLSAEVAEIIDREVVFSLRAKLLGKKTLDELASDKRSLGAMKEYKQKMREEFRAKAGSDEQTKKLLEIHDTVMDSLEQYLMTDESTDVDKISEELKTKLDKLTPSSALRRAIYVLVTAIIGAVIGALVGAALTGGFGLMPGAVIGAKSSYAVMAGAAVGATLFGSLATYGAISASDSEVPEEAYNISKQMQATMA